VKQREQQRRRVAAELARLILTLPVYELLCPSTPRRHRSFVTSRLQVGLPERASKTGVIPRIGHSVSLDHAAELLGVSRRTIYNRIRDGHLKTVRTFGGSQRVERDSVEGELLRRQTWAGHARDAD
jgi:excisionase family DNA binding protein